MQTRGFARMLTAIGATTIAIFTEAGKAGLFFAHTLSQLVRGVRIKLLIQQMAAIGFDSLPIVLLTAFFTGGVLALQTYSGFASATLASTQLGPVVALSMVRELGPVLASLMVAGRVGAAIAAEIGTMRVTEQIDAMKTLATNPLRYLVVPRVLAAILTVPMLVMIANVVGIFGGYLVSTNMLDINPFTFQNSAFNVLEAEDLTLSLTKGAFFGFLVGFWGCYQGYMTKGGAQGVGKATTVAVVYASVSILIIDYFITAIWV